ncbi:acyltransferase family protein [Bythopirellula goksoeyrii]|uniref:Glucans biosynthesis protein n=1 Tax=Bythopirellula goksoeyrii TaxID=1400387 RepID=A0A5B9QD38_9BACT|nr:acyltransferase [Bythopirellula goksoeyrii]QEG36868.1 glucans biosynthesis protein [Bythopirellula goksoeyrii]
MGTAPSDSTRNQGRILELDALRGLAAVAVVLFHFTTRYDHLFSHVTTLSASVPWGHYGVDLFFMLSGFVIFMTLDRQSDPWRFAWGRFSRLYPAYWTAVIVTFAVVSFCGLPGQEVSLVAALVNLTMVQSLLDTPHVDGAYWSLQAELIFYANILACYRLGAFRRPRIAIAIWVGIAALIHIVSAMTTVPMIAGLANKLATITSLKYIPLFGIGMLLYQVHLQRKLTRNDLSLLVGCWATIGIFDGISHALAACFLSLGLFLAVEGYLPQLQSRMLVALGALSYPLYLIHQNIGYVLIRWLESRAMSPGWAIGAALVLTFVLAVLLHQLVEKPALAALRNRQKRTLKSGSAVLNPV